MVRSILTHHLPLLVRPRWRNRLLTRVNLLSSRDDPGLRHDAPRGVSPHRRMQTTRPPLHRSPSAGRAALIQRHDALWDHSLRRSPFDVRAELLHGKSGSVPPSHAIHSSSSGCDTCSLADLLLGRPVRVRRTRGENVDRQLSNG